MGNNKKPATTKSLQDLERCPDMGGLGFRNKLNTWPGVLPLWAEPMSLIRPSRGWTSATRSLLMVAPLGPFGSLPSVNLPVQHRHMCVLTFHSRVDV